MYIFQILREKEFEPIPESFYGYIEDWMSWYRGKVDKFHSYRVFNGSKHIRCQRFSMGMAKKACEDWADLLMNEKVQITLEGEAEQGFIDRVFRENNFAVMGNEAQEWKAALGTVAYVPRVAGVEIEPMSGAVKGAESIKIDFIRADGIIPLFWENGSITECAFVSRKAVGKANYCYLQIHRLAGDGNYDIENCLYRDSNGSLAEVELTAVPGFEQVPPVIHTGSRRRQFVIDRLNIANNLADVPMGISVFANAIDSLKGVDVAYDSYVNEFILGKKRIMVQPQATKNIEGEPLFDADELAFYVLPEDRGSEGLIKEIDMTLRTEEHKAGMQDMLHVLSNKCGFGENHWRYDKGTVTTATEVISSNSHMFRTLKKHEIILEAALTELCRILLRMGNAYMGTGLDEEVEISIDFDDSIIEDKEVEFNRTLRLLSAGLINSWEARAKLMNEDEETAKAALPGTGINNRE